MVVLIVSDELGTVGAYAFDTLTEAKAEASLQPSNVECRIEVDPDWLSEEEIDR